MSRFSSLLEELMDGAGGEPPTVAAPSLSRDFLSGIIGLQGLDARRPAAPQGDAYGDVAPPRAALAELPADRATVAAELGLRPGLGSGELARIRRRFARDNHPDRMPASLRAQATARMTTANTLIDEAESAARGRHR